MEFISWLSLASICLFGAMTPGPSLAVVLKHTLSGGRKNGVLTSVAHGVGVALYAVITVLGLAVIIQQSPWLYQGLTYCGAIFLLWLAYKSFTHKSVLATDIVKIKPPSNKASFYQGFMIAFLNPKLAIFFLALFSQFIHIDSSGISKIMMVLTVASIDTLWYCLIASVFSHPFILQKLSEKIHFIDKITGIALLIVAARVIFN